MMVGVGSFSDAGVNAVAGIAGTDLPTGTGLTVNLGGAYFQRGGTAGYGTTIAGGSDAAMAFILIHELAHLTGARGFLEGDSSVAPQTFNNQLVLDRCGGTVYRAAGQPRSSPDMQRR